MEFFRRAEGVPARLAILAGTFNPPTVAHLALADAALPVAGEVLFALPRRFPHKPYEGASFEQRVELLKAALSGRPRCSLAATRGGLFIEIARECREVYPPQVKLSFVCGRDAAERIVNWDYGRRGAILEMLAEFDLLVADRGGRYDPPAHLRDRIRTLALPPAYDEVSATEVRTRMAEGKPWEHLVPASITGMVREIYASRPAPSESA